MQRNQMIEKLTQQINNLKIGLCGLGGKEDVNENILKIAASVLKTSAAILEHLRQFTCPWAATVVLKHTSL